MHLTHESNEALLARLGIAHPVAKLEDSCEKLLQKCALSHDQMVSHPLVLRHLSAVREQLTTCRIKHPLSSIRTCTPANVAKATEGTFYDGDIVQADGLTAAALVCDVCLLSFGTLQALKHHYKEQHLASLPVTGSRFDRWRHSIHGLPTCAHCGHAFGSWGDLQRHIEGRHCAQMWKVHTQQTRRASTTSALCLPPSQQPRPMLYNEVLHTMLCMQGWHHALDHYTEISQLANHCGLCGQWIVDSQHLKTHSRRTHSLEWQKYSSQVSIKCRQLARSIVSSCRWCGTYLKRPAPHANKCAVAFQLCLLSEILGCKDGAGRSAVIRWLSSTAATSCPADGGSPGAAPREHGTSAGPSIPGHASSQVHCHATKKPENPCARASRLGEKETAGSGTTISSLPRVSRAGPMGKPLDSRGLLLKAFECGARPLHEGSHDNGYPADLAARRSATTHGPGHNTCLDDEELSGGRLSGVADVPGDGSLATTTAGRQDAASANLAGCSVAFPSAADRGATPESSGGSHQSCCAKAQRLALPRRGLALHEVGESEGGAHSGHPTCDDESHFLSSGPDRDPNVPGAIPGGVASQVPGDTSPDGRDAGTHCHLSFRDITAARIRRRPVSHLESLVRVGVSADRWPPDQASPAATSCPGNGDTAGAYKAVLTSALLNPSNLCYVNTFAVSYAWCLAACEGDLCSFLGRSWEAFRVLLQRSAKPFQLTGLLSWRILLQGWSDITSQHDAAEFADFVLGRLERILCFGTWEAWFVQGGQLVRKFDQGLNRHIQVTVSPGEQSLADCIGAWATQEAPTDLEDIHLRHTPLVYMLCSPPPPFLLLQIKRFGNSMAGTQKMFAPVCSEAGRAYFIPVRVNAATVTLRAYYLIAVIYHLGETTTSGHYKCILHRYVTGRWMSWVTDDGRTAAVATKADLQTAACNSYLAWMQHASDIPDETMSLT